ncbi:hypothetical protein ASG41_20815 [Modestobacter sp. Leaf380]|nr:hypothetical protein ASG41_20815 [Modestobacter sp. Leaf380]
MHVVPAQPPASDFLGSAVRPPAATVGDAAQLLHVDLQEIVGGIGFVADLAVPPAAQQFTGEPVDLSQSR